MAILVAVATKRITAFNEASKESAMFKRILVAVDGSTTAARGLKLAIELARDQGASLTVLHVIDEMAALAPMASSYVPPSVVDSMIESLQKAGRKLLDHARAAAGKRDVAARAVLVDAAGNTVAGAILGELRKQKADLLVLGTHGRRGVQRLLVGSDAEVVLREANVPVLMVRSPTPSRKHARPSAAKR
jgi:nucleotide-binding universal stress UspA family protein